MYTEIYQEHSKSDQSRVSNQSSSKTQKESVISDDKKKCWTEYPHQSIIALVYTNSPRNRQPHQEEYQSEIQH